MADRIVRLVVNARVDAERPELCSEECPHMSSEQPDDGDRFCMLFGKQLDFNEEEMSDPLLRLSECLAAESQPDEKP